MSTRDILLFLGLGLYLVVLLTGTTTTPEVNAILQNLQEITLLTHCLISLIGLIGLISPIGLIGPISPIGPIGLISPIGPISPISPIGPISPISDETVLLP